MSSDDFLNKRLIRKINLKDQQVINRTGLDRKTQDEVFDKTTLHTLEKLISDKIIDIIDFPISTGKEGNVFRCLTPEKKFVALKIYRTSTSTFKHISKYIIGDPRFKDIHKNRRDTIFSWTLKEFKNLERLSKIGVRAPKPITSINNVLVMQYLGKKNSPSPMLKDTYLDNPEKVFSYLIDSIDKMYKKANLVHSDLSPFNILIYRNKPYIIDLGQGVLLEHQNSMEFLRRDISNIVNYFKKYNINTNENDIYQEIVDNAAR